MDGVEFSHRSDLDWLTRPNGSGNPCRNDNDAVISTKADIAKFTEVEQLLFQFDLR